MRILHINCNYIGTKLHQSMIAKLSELGVENSIYVPTYLKDASVADVDAEVCISNCFRKWDRVAFDYKQYKIISDIEKKFDISKFDCIHAYTLFTDGHVAKKLSEKYGVPYIVAVRGVTDIDTFFKRVVYLRSRGISIMKKAKMIFFLSDVPRKIVFKKYVPDRYKVELFAKTRVIPNGIDDFWLENKNKEKKVFDPSSKVINIVYAGRVVRRKNITMTQKAVDILRKYGYTANLTVIGVSNDTMESRRIMSHAYTKCYRAAPKEKLINAYRHNDLFVMPSHSETFGLVYAEAMSQGLPVIYTKDQGFDGQFDEGLVGYAVDDYDPTDIADKIMTVCGNYDKISENCINNCEKFNWNEIVKEYYNIYEQIIRSKNK